MPRTNPKTPQPIMTNNADIVLPVGPIAKLEFTVNIDAGTPACDAMTFTLTPSEMKSLSRAKHLLFGFRVADSTPDNQPRETAAMLLFPADIIQRNAQSIRGQTEA